MRLNILRRSKLYRITISILLAIIAWSAVDIVNVRYALARDEQVAHFGNEKIFIASILWNNEALLKSHWISAVVDLVKEIGHDNAFVSVYESGSWDNTKDALRVLDAELEKAGVRRKITLDPSTHVNEISKPPAELGWIWTPRNKMELRRIPYLARLRNLVLEPLYEMRKSGETFDKVFFLNDVVFTSRDVRRLVSTHGGDYAAACALDFSHPPRFYDTFALRDSEGYDFLMYTWPYFRARDARRALKTSTAVPVTSCWNGMGE